MKNNEEADKVRYALTHPIVIGDGRDAIEHPELRVKSAAGPNHKGFRRGGIFFPRGQEVAVPADTLNKERYELIVNEPMLVVVKVEVPKKKA